MSPDLLDGVLIEVASIAEQAAGNVEGVLHALKDLFLERGIRATLP